MAGQEDLPTAAAAEAERGLGDALARHMHVAATLHVGEPSLADHLVHRRADLRLVTAQEPLAVDGALAPGVLAAIDQVAHERLLTRSGPLRRLPHAQVPLGQ